MTDEEVWESLKSVDLDSFDAFVDRAIESMRIPGPPALPGAATAYLGPADPVTCWFIGGLWSNCLVDVPAWRIAQCDWLAVPDIPGPPCFPSPGVMALLPPRKGPPTLTTYWLQFPLETGTPVYSSLHGPRGPYWKFRLRSIHGPCR